MPHSFRFEPPEPRPGSLTRPRLLRALLTRWDRRVAVVTGGAGLGKTTLLAQSIAENNLAPRGRDVWLGLEADDAGADSLARDLLAALEPRGAGGGGRDQLCPRAVADAVWRQAPVQVCLVLDNVHLIPADSAGAAWLAELVDILPGNGHLLLASRSTVPVPMGRLATQAALARIGEDELRFTEPELEDFAARRAIDRRRLDGTGGWPAMAELAASVEGEGSLTRDYLWEEVLEPLGRERRHTLAVVVDLGGADDGLASAALDHPVKLALALADVPLMDVGSDGWREPHPLWTFAQSLCLDARKRVEVRRRAVAYLRDQRRFDDAVTLLRNAGIPDLLNELLPGVIRAACLTGARPTVAQLDRWLAISPHEVRSSAPGRLAEALRATLIAPGECIEPLREAAKLFRDEGDVEGELAAIANIGRAAWWRQDLGVLLDLAPRVGALAAEGITFAEMAAFAGRAIIADLEGDDEGLLSELSNIELERVDQAWQAIGKQLIASVVASMGDVAGARAHLVDLPPNSDPNFAFTLATFELVLRWMEGDVDGVAAELPGYVERLRTSPVAHNLETVLPLSSRLLAHVGQADRAREQLDEAEMSYVRDLEDPAVSLALAEASVCVAEGDEARAADVLGEAAARHGLDRGVDRRLWRHALALSYVLVPEVRARWDAAPLSGYLVHARRLAAAVVAARSGDTRSLHDLDLPPLGVVRSVLHHRFAVDLAVGLQAAGHPGGPGLLEAVGPVGRHALRELASTATSRRAKPAKALLAAVPAPPPTVTEVAVLGPLSVQRDGEEIRDPALRRERLRALLAYLVSHRDTTRSAIMAALWPDLDERAAGNNLRVTLTYLLRLLEPWRAPGESAFHVRTDGNRVQLVTGDWLRIDVDRFDGHLAAAARAESDGTPSLALEHNLAATDLYRGDLHTGVDECEWNTLDRDHYRSRFVAAATRAGQLLSAKGEADAAEAVARRAIAVDQWAEDAYAVLVTTALSRGDRSGARQALDRCLEALADLGVDPSEEVQHLRRRVRGAA